MKRSLMDILACPKCKGKIELEVKDEKNDEIITGTLLCKSCKIDYPIDDGIPNLLIPDGK